MAAGLLVFAGICAIQARQALTAAAGGRDALIRAERDLRDRRVDGARAHLLDAKRSFTVMKSKVRRLGPVLAVARFVPFVRVQVRGVDALMATGTALADGGLRFDDAADALLGGDRGDRPIGSTVNQLGGISAQLSAGIDAFDRGLRSLAKLDGYRLVGPLASARNDLAKRLPEISKQAHAARSGLDALLSFAAVGGRRTYLVFSQNPDEVRPTGGFIGTYGLLKAENGVLSLDRYASIESWLIPRPDVAVPAAQAPTAFRILDPPVPQVIANVNSTPNWPDAARLAADLWVRGGEQPVEGVLSFTPDFLSRLLTVIGPVDVAEYGEQVTAANVVDRVDYHTHLEGSAAGAASTAAVTTDRKRFIVDLAQVVIQRLLILPTRRLEALGTAVATGLDAREGMAWVADPKVAEPLAARGWDGALPATTGDFFFDGEFEYAAKNGRSLKRTFEHDVSVEPDGSGRVETRITIANTAPFTLDGFSNIDSLSYITLYGPQGATLDTASDPPDSREPDVAGHPAYGWLRGAEPLGTTTLRVVWRVPNLAERLKDGTWEYRLDWFRLAGHTGDVVRVRVHLPAGWRWRGKAPPPETPLDGDLHGKWAITGTPA